MEDSQKFMRICIWKWDFDFKKCIKEPNSYNVLSLRCTNSREVGWSMLPAQVMKVLCSLLYSRKKKTSILFPYHYEQEIYLKKE